MGRISLIRPGRQLLVVAALLVGAYALSASALATSTKTLRHGPLSRNTCTGNLREPKNWRDLGINVRLDGRPVLNNSHDSWDPFPNYNSHIDNWHWSSVSGISRGCSNTVQFKNLRNPSDTIEIYLSDPYRGGNSWHCKATGRFKCGGPSGQIRGNHLNLTYYLELK